MFVISSGLNWNSNIIFFGTFSCYSFCVSLIIRHRKHCRQRCHFGIFYTNFRHKNKGRVTGTLIRVAYFCLVKFYRIPIVEARHVVEMNKIYISVLSAPARACSRPNGKFGCRFNGVLKFGIRFYYGHGIVCCRWFKFHAPVSEYQILFVDYLHFEWRPCLSLWTIAFVFPWRLLL